jgi:subtilisin family serine protease
MSHPTSPSSGSGPLAPVSGLLARLRRILPWPTRLQPVRDLRSETHKVQLDLVRRALGRDGLGGDPAAAAGDAYLAHPSRVLVLADDVDVVDEFFASQPAVYDGPGRVVEEPVGELRLYDLPGASGGGAVDLELTLTELDDQLGEGRVRPDHIVYVTPKGAGALCPAEEPDLPPRPRPVPPLNPESSAGQDIRVSVVDTGWYGEAATNPATPWLSKGVEGDLEEVDPEAIHPYAGHGTFVAGIVRCQAPAVTIEVEGCLTQAGTCYESDIIRELNEAMLDPEQPDLISISAGTYTRKNLGMLGFEELAAEHHLNDGESAVLVVAAAGNNSDSRPFFPAAYDYVVAVGSVDADLKVSDFSNFGPWVNVYACGRDLVNAFPSGRYTCYEPAYKGEVRTFTGLARWCGTSFSTPVVTGAIAARMIKGKVSARESRDLLIASGKPVNDAKAKGRVSVG